MSEQQLTEIAGREAAATEGPWCTDECEVYKGAEYYAGAVWIGETCRVDDGDSARADAAFIAAARTDVPVLLAEVELLQEHLNKALVAFNAQSLRVTELEAERHGTNEALSDTAEALRAANTAASLVAEYRVPLADDDGRWLSVRREPNGDRWAVMAWTVRVRGADRSMAWVGGRWQVLPAYGENGVWEFGSADAALAEATRLAEAGDPR